MSKFDELKKLAEAATQGAWLVKEELGHDEAWCDWHAVGPFELPGGKAGNDSKFIAAANPAAILELLAIQAQLVAALRHPALYELIGNVEDSMDSATWSKAVIFMEARDAAIAAAGAQP